MHGRGAAFAVDQERSGKRVHAAILLRGQIVAYREFFDTPNTKGKRFGWQSDADWIAAIKSMEAAGVIKPGRKPADYYTNQFVD